MLQRIQTVYWGLTLFCLGVLLSGVDLVSFKKDGIEFKLSIFSLKQFDKSDKLIKESSNFNYVLVIFIMLFIIFTVFQFKNLRKQLNFAKWSMFLTILITIQFILFSYSGMIVSNPASVKLNFWISLLLIACVFSVLAYLGVKKDKSLLDSVDRIR
jgi:amino acid transporter